MPMSDPARRTHVLIVGCGFGGLEAARRLQRADVGLTDVEKTDTTQIHPNL